MKFFQSVSNPTDLFNYNTARVDTFINYKVGPLVATLKDDMNKVLFDLPSFPQMSKGKNF